MNENDRQALEKLYEITNDKIVKILIDWNKEYEEFIGEPGTYVGDMYEDVMNCVWDKYNLNEIEKIIHKDNAIEDEEEEKFKKNIKIWEQGIKFAKERIIEFYDKEKTSDDVKYITLETVGKQYSKKLANVMFDCGYGEWVFIDSGTLEKMKKQMIDILEDDKGLNELLEEKNITREQLYRKIKEDFLESELSNLDMTKIPILFEEEEEV